MKTKKPNPFGFGLKRRLPTLPRENRSTIGVSELNLRHEPSAPMCRFDWLRLDIACKHTLCSACTIVLCFTERYSSLTPWHGVLRRKTMMAASSRENRIFGLSIFIFAQEVYCAVMKNDDLDSTPVQPSSLSESYTKEAPPYTKRYKL